MTLPACPHCGHHRYVIQELGRTDGKLDVFADDPDEYTCSPFVSRAACGTTFSARTSERAPDLDAAAAPSFAAHAIPPPQVRRSLGKAS